ncbi:erythropoietin isoform X2 [Eublepharis macularius]|uniref:Erythropoietin n=1 Tax=Eublepharis macularius TaxID=481883 RepID=A0AA97LDC6_EUBMA|nr:erythropoietin isoform X2 [Eublepharis macularius]
MGISGLFPFLLVLELLAPPALLTPLHPICDPRVMDKYILEAQWADQDIARVCAASCGLSETVQVPDTKRARQASEVWGGLALLLTALSQAQERHPATLDQLARMRSALLSVREILRSVNVEADARLLDTPPTPTLNIRTVEKLLSIYLNFLRGKANLYITEACRNYAR